MSDPSKRRAYPAWLDKLVPVLLVILALALLSTLVIIGLALLGLTPGQSTF